MNGFNLSNIQDAKLGSTQVSALYYGSTKIWESTPDYSRMYFTIESLADRNMVYFDTVDSNQTSLGKSIEYSTDLINWTSVTDECEEDAYSFITLSQGQKVYLRGTNSKYANSISVYDEFWCYGDFNLSGNIMSLIYGSNFIGQTILNDTYTFTSMFRRSGSKLKSITNLVLPATTLAFCCYAHMFHNCNSITAAPALPATTLANYCYQYMFEGCSSLTTAPALPATTLAHSCYMSMFAGTKVAVAPELPATTLANSCYRNMFYGCTSITTVPELPATTLTDRCYQHMFYGCTSLTTVPELPATTLVTYCYNNMFNGCSSLNYIKMMATDISASNCLNNWVYGVATYGVFVKNPNATWTTTGVSAVPTNWAVSTVEPKDQYLTFNILNNNTRISFDYSDDDIENENFISYSTNNGVTFTYLTDSGITVNKGNVMFRSDDSYYTPQLNDDDENIHRFSVSNSYIVFGNIMSLLYGRNFSDKTEITRDYEFNCLFYGQTNLLDASNLILPATTLADDSYSYMFYGCTSLTTAPVLPALTPSAWCYSGMFQGCSSLNYIKMMATDISNGPMSNWVYGVASSGTFVKNSAATWNVTGVSGIPSGWTVVNV